MNHKYPLRSFMKKKLVILSKDQFGYLTDTYKYCQYLREDYDITCICLDWNKPRIALEDVTITYIEMKKGFVIKFLYFILQIVKKLKVEEYTKVFCVYFRLCFILSFFIPNHKLILDIRTGNVSNHRWRRVISNLELKWNTLFFKNITIISEGLAKKLKLKRYEIIPVGSEKWVEKSAEKSLEKSPEKNSEKNPKNPEIDGLKLLYIGTLTNRRVEDTIIGFKEFVDKHGSVINCLYTIIGNGSEEEERKLKGIIQELGLESKVSMLGWKNHSELGAYLARHNIGVSYIPITSYYTHQPPTKTYDYLMNGLICLATATNENSKLITRDNGVLCLDHAESFAQGLEEIYSCVDNYNREEIVSSVENHHWREITNIHLKKMLMK